MQSKTPAYCTTPSVGTPPACAPNRAEAARLPPSLDADVWAKMTSLMQGWVFGTYDIDLLFDDRIKHQKAHRVAIGISSPSTDLLHISPRCPSCRDSWYNRARMRDADCADGGIRGPPEFPSGFLGVPRLCVITGGEL